ncbi:MAG: amidohydrolase family protein, partial [Methanobacterium paludis]|nr:amidohydrolase family protein [Methanobacterium paludis]
MITIENAKVLYGENLEVVRANVLIEDNKITEVSQKVSEGKIIDASGCIIAPSLINSHIHIGDSVAKDAGDGKSIDKIVKPPDGIKHKILRKTPPEKIMAAMTESMRYMLETGTTTFVDFREGGSEGIKLLDEASKGIPIKKIVLGRHESFLDPDAESSTIKSNAKKILRSCDGIWLSGFGEISNETAKIITDTCSKEGKISSIHVAEYEKVQEDSLMLHGKTEVQRALEVDFDLLVHLTSPMDNDLKNVGKSRIPIVSCPRSNGALSVGIPPIQEMMDNRIKILLGTDNVMFNSPNMFREMEYALKVTRGYYRKYFSPVEIFKMATVNAARALGLNSGSIEEGRIADIMIVKEISKNPLMSLMNRT